MSPHAPAASAGATAPAARWPKGLDTLLVVLCMAAACASPPAAPSQQAAGVMSEPPPSVVHAARLGGPGPAALSAWINTAEGRAVLTVDTDAGRWVSPIYPAWWVAVGDLDGDALDEVVLGTWSTTPRHDEPQPHRSVWVLTWQNARLEPRWKGSALGRPIEQLALHDVDADGRSELLALEHSAEACYITVYRATTFGFEGLARRAVVCGVTLLEGGAGVTVQGHTEKLVLHDGELELMPTGGPRRSIGRRGGATKEARCGLTKQCAP